MLRWLSEEEWGSDEAREAMGAGADDVLAQMEASNPEWEHRFNTDDAGRWWIVSERR